MLKNSLILALLMLVEWATGEMMITPYVAEVSVIVFAFVTLMQIKKRGHLRSANLSNTAVRAIQENLAFLRRMQLSAGFALALSSVFIFL